MCALLAARARSMAGRPPSDMGRLVVYSSDQVRSTNALRKLCGTAYKSGCFDQLQLGVLAASADRTRANSPSSTRNCTLTTSVGCWRWRLDIMVAVGHHHPFCCCSRTRA